MPSLCVNIDHIATLRQARLETEPDPLAAAWIVEKAGAHGITVHLREDRRHIQDQDVLLLRKKVRTKLNLEMAPTKEMVSIALKIRPDQVTLVPEKRRELTTEGGLDLGSGPYRIESAVDQLQSKGIPVSLFIDPDLGSVKRADRLGATYVELHTGAYSLAWKRKKGAAKELSRLFGAALQATALGLRVHAGHGLTYANTGPVARIPDLEDLNIGHNIVARAALVGLHRAVKEMLWVLRSAEKSGGRMAGRLPGQRKGKRS